MCVVILGDVHLGRSTSLGKNGIGSTLNSRIVDQVNLLDWTLEQAISQHANHIIITGDIFEEPKPHPHLIVLFISWLKRCQTQNINVHIIVGNHDILRSGFVHTSSLDIISEADLELISIYKDINTIIIGTSAFTLVPFRDRKSFGVASNAEATELIRDSLVYELAAIPITYTKVLIGHLVIEGSIPIGDEIDDLTNEIFCPLDMFNGYDYVWMGHVHKPQIMKSKNPFIAHIGSMDISNFGETDHKKHIIIFDPLSPENWKMEYLPTRNLHKVNITVPQNTSDTTQYVIDELEKNNIKEKSIVRVEVVLSSPEMKSINKSDVDRFLNTKGVFSVAGISESKRSPIIKKNVNDPVIDTKVDIISAINMYAKLHVDSSQRDLFIETTIDLYKMYKAEAKD